ncbi:MAG TPA: ABC transporter ATP-binding protein [Anaerolineales bacterium]|nr:ABC transporter ATP-binding protein [Anaerolineales bacterium]
MTNSNHNPYTPDFDLKHAVHENRFVGMWRMMQGFRGRYLGATASAGVASAMKTATFLLVEYLIDDVIGKSQLNLLPWVGLAFIGFALLEGGATFLSGWLAAQTAEGIALRLRNYLFDHIQRLTFSYHDRTQTGELLQRATSDVDTIQRFFLQQALDVGRILLLFTINFIAIAFINVRLAFISVIVLPPIFAVSIWFFKQIEKAYEAYQEQEAKLSSTLQENLSGVRVVKAFARQQYEMDKFEVENKEKLRRGIKLLMMHASYWPTTDIVAGAQMLGGFTTGALMAINGTITIGDYLAYAGMLIWIIWPMRNLGRLIVQGSEALVSYSRVAEIIKQEREPLTEGTTIPRGELHGEVIFENVHFAYDENTPVLHNILFHAKPGQVIALMGPTGSGKTSLVNLLPRFYEYQHGRILLDRTELKDYPRAYLRSQIGIVEQEPFLFSRTIRENIAYGVARERGREVSDEEVYQAARAAAIHDVILSFPEGYKTLVGERGVTLSGGQKQRVAVARTLLKNPRILILDDATSSVDTETEAAIRQALDNLMENRTTFIIAHRIQTVMHADQILVFDKGHIVQQGTHEDLLEDEGGIYRRIFDVQARIEEEVEKEIASVIP